jgi:inosose dehydratase
MTPARITVGNAPVSWGVMEVAGWGKQIPYSQLLDEIQRAGYAGTELGPYGYFPTDPETLASELSTRELHLIASFVPIPLAHSTRHEDAYKKAMEVADLLAKVGAPLIVLADEMSEMRMAVSGRVDELRDGMTESQWKGAARILSRLASDCREIGVSAVFHHHAGTFIETPKEVARLCASTDSDLLGLCLDTGHYLFGGGDPSEAVSSYGSRIRHLHLKDVRLSVLTRAREDKVGFLDAVRRGVFCELGEGDINLKAVVERLAGLGYSGWAVVEQDVDTRNEKVKPLESAIRSRQFLRNEIGI